MIRKSPIINNRRPTISVLIPAYNASNTLGEAVESILNQSYRNFEVVIIDDASTDATWNIIKKYAAKDKRIRPYRNKTNLYIAQVRNQLITYARGIYVAWQDADDISVSDRLKLQMNILEKNKRIGIVGGYLQFFDEENGDLSLRKYKTDDASLRRTIFRYSPVAQPAAMIRRKCFAELGTYNPAFPPAEDIDMSFRIGTKYQFANIPRVVLRYRLHYTSATFKRLRHIELTTISIRKSYMKNPAYTFSFVDLVYNIIQFLLIFVLPARLKITLFNYFRNSSV